MTVVNVPLGPFRKKATPHLSLLSSGEVAAILLTQWGYPLAYLVKPEIYARLVESQDWNCPHCHTRIENPASLSEGWTVMGTETRVAACPHCDHSIRIVRQMSQAFSVTKPDDGEEAE